ncbi:MAG: NAD-dependent epimerase/dehydratase family protein [Chloroflexi bacterium]|nr:NAD-dependent epimerase/dehydratase family protein [Chloroflexota bacterium]
MNVLITGGCGFVGVNLVIYLSQKGYRTRILDDLSTARPDYVQVLRSAGSPEVIVGDIRDGDIMNRALEKMEAVVHLAACTSVIESVENPKRFWDINVSGTLNVLEACRLRGVDRFVFASSNAAVGEQIPPIDENMIPKPLSPYGASKLAGEALCSAYYHSFGMKAIALRFANLYGPYSDHKTSVLAKFMGWAREDHPFTIYGDGNQTRDFVHVEDICQAIDLSLSSQDSSGDVFQIASGKETSINRLVEIVREVTDKRSEVIHQPERKGEIRRNYSDISKARRVLGFEPRMELKEGLRKLWSACTQR